MPCRTASAFPLFWARFTTVKRSGCSSCSDSRSRNVPSPLPSLTRTSSRSSPGTEKRRSSSTGRRCSSLKQGMTRARRDTARHCGGWPSIPQPDVVEHLPEPLRPHVLGARAVVIGLRDAGALALVREIELHLVDAVVEIVERHELLPRLVVALQVRARAADHQRPGKGLL